jgi:serine/threonine-protein kinase SRPK3
MLSDLHSGNIFLRLPESINSLSPSHIYNEYSLPALEPIKPLHENMSFGNSVPSHVVFPIWLGKPSDELTLSEARIFLADFGESFSPSTTNRNYPSSPAELRPPEVYFEPDKPLSFAAEIWSLACTIFSILGQRPLIDAYWPDHSDWMIQEHVDVLGKPPLDWWNMWEGRKDFFDEQVERKNGEPRRSLEERFEYSIQEPRRECTLGEINEEEKNALITMLRAMMAYDPMERPSATEILESDWMKKWGLSDLHNM